MATKSNPFDKAKSLLIMASNLNCLPSEVKSKFHSDLKTQNFNRPELELMLKELPRKKYAESVELNLDPEDTPSSYVETWIEEYLVAMETEKMKINKRIEDSLADNPGLRKIIEDSGDIGQYLDQNQDVVNSLVDSLTSSDDPAEKYRLKAIDKIFDEKDYLGAINIINQGLKLNDKKTEPFLFSLRSECFIRLKDNEKALSDVELAVESIKANAPLDLYNLSEFYEDLFDLHFANKNFGHALTSINQALEIANLDTRSSFRKSKYFKKRARLYESLGNSDNAKNDSNESEKFNQIWIATEKNDNALPF